MLAYPFFGRQDDKFPADLIEDRHLSSIIPEPEIAFRKIQFKHVQINKIIISGSAAKRYFWTFQKRKKLEEVLKIVNDIKAGQISPLYFLMGEETYYIDKLSEFIEENILSEEERGFNQTVYYGRDVSIDDIVSAARRFPMMAERQVIIVREAQDLIKTIDNLVPYVENPMPSTVLVMCYKYKELDKRKKLRKIIEKNAVVFIGNKLKEYQVPDWIKRILSGKNYAIEPKAAAMLTEFLGNDLGKISNELYKLQIILPKGSTITAKHIEENIGISKDYNNFEMTSAIAEKNQLKAYQIADYFAHNQKDNPLLLTTAMLFNFFSVLLQYHGLKDKSQKASMASLKMGYPRFLEISAAYKHYPMKKTSAIVSAIRETDVKSKGVHSNAASSDLLKELLVKIFN